MLVDASIAAETSTQFKTEEAAIAAIQNLGTDGNSTTEQTDLINALASAIINTNYASALADATISGAWSSYKAKDETVTTSLAVGAYLVIPTSSNMAFLNMMVSVDATLDSNANNTWKTTAHGAVLKGEKLGITKTVNEGETAETNATDKDDVEIGETVTYTLTVDVPHFPANETNDSITFKITDVPTNVTLKADSVTVYGRIVGSPDEELSSSTDYTLDTTTNPGTMEIDLSINYVAKIHKYQKIYVVYQATLESTANMNAESDGNPNTATLSYADSTHSTANTATAKAVVYTYQSTIAKVDATDSTKLANTTFQVKRESETDAMYFVDITESGATTKTYRVATSSTETNATQDLVTGSDGLIILKGLDSDTNYIVSETKAPSGYSISSNVLKFSLTANTPLNGYISTYTANEYENASAQTALAAADRVWSNVNYYETGSTTNILGAALTLKDTKIAALPATGSIGIIVFTIAGVAIMILALILINGGKSKEKAGQGMKR
ncbi:MAG: LPXTG cell wall anchor domain-containing protein [Clostridiales bacterium]|nr:LPXTG cell wall anchor domain-containing protein [Clostridiales bacterium]